MAKRIVLAGGSGFVGQALAASFLADGWEVHILSRGKASGKLLGTFVPWDGATIGSWAESLEDAAAVINLAGKNINCRQTSANRLEIVRSRVDSVKAVGEAIRCCSRPPRVFVQTTAVGIYGDAGDMLCDESTPAGDGFLGETCRHGKRQLKIVQRRAYAASCCAWASYWAVPVAHFHRSPNWSATSSAARSPAAGNISVGYI